MTTSPRSGLVDDRAVRHEPIRVPRKRGAGRGWLVRRALLAADLAGLTLVYVASQILITDHEVGRIDLLMESLLFVCVLPLWPLAAKVYGLYDRDEERTDHSTVDDLAGVFHLVTVGVWVIFAGARLTDLAAPELPRLVLFWALAIAVVPVLRAGARSWCRSRIEYLQNVVIVGEGEVGSAIARKLLRHPEYGLNLVGFVDSGTATGGSDGTGRVLGGVGDLQRVVETHEVARVIVAFPRDARADLLAAVRRLSLGQVQIDVVPRLHEMISPGVSIHSLEGSPLVGLPRPALSRSSQLLKRLLDVTVAGLVVIIAAPLFGLIAALIKLETRGPILFRQLRVGKDGKPFTILKFRTMIHDADARKAEVAHLNAHAQNGDGRMFKIPGDPRITRVGRFLRRYALDELPQLVNVLRGEMSLVGPRPLIRDEDREVEGWGRRRLALKPGLTGLWQVSGSSKIGFSEMVDLDYLYVTSWSLSRDLALLLRTIPVVVRGSNGLD